MWRLTAVAALMNLPAYPRVVTPTVVLPVSLLQGGSLPRRDSAWADVCAPGAARPSTTGKAAIQCVVLAASSAFGGRTARFQNVKLFLLLVLLVKKRRNPVRKRSAPAARCRRAIIYFVCLLRSVKLQCKHSRCSWLAEQ